MNQILGASLSPSIIHSGGSVTATVDFSAQTSGAMSIAATVGFTIKPNQHTLQAGQIQDTFSIEIRRHPGAASSCELTFTFRGSSKSAFATVNGVTVP